jgi:hypothetical protein
MEGNKDASQNLARGHEEYPLGRAKNQRYIQGHDHVSSTSEAVVREVLTRGRRSECRVHAITFGIGIGIGIRVLRSWEG